VRHDDEDLTVRRRDFWVATANKQLNFIQHVVSLLKSGGRAAVVIPDNVLFEGGAAAVVRRSLLETCHVHTLLRLPTGLFYAQGVKSNVLFFDRMSRAASDRHRLWVYDLRSDNRFSLKTNPLRREDLDDFVRMYRSRAEETPHQFERQRWRAFDISELLKDADARLDIAWDQESPAPLGSSLSRLDNLSRLISADLENALLQIARVAGKRRSE
jgi:type I restriction enzyme M protein